MAKHFTFPGFEVTGNDDNDGARVDIGTITYAGKVHTLRMMLPANAPKHGEYLVARVELGERALWQFDRGRDSACLTHLALVADEPVIAFVDRKSNRVTKTQPFSRFHQRMPLPLRKQVEIKRLAAEYLGLTAEYSVAERKFQDVDPTERQKASEAAKRLAAERAEAEAEAKRRRKERDEKREKIRLAVAGREEVKVKTKDGIRRGRPILKREIAHLEPNRLYVLVEAIDKDGVPHEPLSAFRAKAVKGKGIVRQHEVEAIDFHDDTLVMPEPTGSDIFAIADEVYEVPIYADMAAIETLEAIGVEMVEFAAYPQGNQGQFMVFVLNGTDGKTRALKAGLKKPYTGEEELAAAE